MPFVSVVIPNYNNEKYLEECVESLTAQTYQDFEIIIVDDGSTDNSVAVINSLKSRYPNVRLVHQVNAGPCAARNNGVRNSSGTYIAFLDADDLWLPHKLERQMDMVKKANADLVYCKYLWFNEEGTFPNPQVNQSPTSPFDFWFDTYASPSNVLMNKKKFLEIGSWDERLNATADVELWSRAAICQLKIESTNEFDVMSRQHNTSMKTRYRYMYDDHVRSYRIMVDLALAKGYQIKDFFPYAQKKLNKMKWYTHQMGRKDLTFGLFVLGFKTLRTRYLNRLTIYQLLKFPFVK